jgi:hypothetical protein
LSSLLPIGWMTIPWELAKVAMGVVFIVFIAAVYFTFCETKS